MLELLGEPGGQVIYTPPDNLERDAEFELVCALYPELRVEMTCDGWRHPSLDPLIS